jgi:hypothetical protein
MKKKINLGTAPMATLKSKPDNPETGDADSYPELNIQDHEDPAIMNIPDEGTSTIHHQVIQRSESMRHGKKRHSVTLRVKSIEPHGLKGGKKLAGAAEDEKAVDEGLPD